ncbi:MAG: hypothetical protein ACLUPZ_03310 [Lachnospiraceae bacterium]
MKKNKVLPHPLKYLILSLFLSFILPITCWADNSAEQPVFDTSIHGRGHSDSGREEPQYVGLYGYTALTSYEAEKESVDPSNAEQLGTTPLTTPWYVPTYTKIDADHYQESVSLEHKTIVKVISQDLTHDGWGVYSGYLDVNVVGDQTATVYTIDVSNFITNAYWDMPILNSIGYGCCLAKYSQVSEYLPVYNDNRIADIPPESTVLISTIMDAPKVDASARQIEARYYYDANDGDEYSTIYFNIDDLTIIY